MKKLVNWLRKGKEVEVEEKYSDRDLKRELYELTIRKMREKSGLERGTNSSILNLEFALNVIKKNDFQYYYISIITPIEYLIEYDLLDHEVYDLLHEHSNIERSQGDLRSIKEYLLANGQIVERVKRSTRRRELEEGFRKMTPYERDIAFKELATKHYVN